MFGIVVFCSMYLRGLKLIVALRNLWAIANKVIGPFAEDAYSSGLLVGLSSSVSLPQHLGIKLEVADTYLELVFVCP